MIKIEFTKEEVEKLLYERYNHPHLMVQRKAEALILKSHGLKHKDICRITDITGNTLRSYLCEYQKGGIEEIKKVNLYKPRSEMMNHAETIENYFKKNPPAGIKEAMAKIKELTGINRTENRVREFLRRIGMKRRKIGMIPAKADTEEQEKFLKTEMTPRLEEAKAGNRAVFFVDGAHFVLSPFLGYLWSFVRIFIKAPSGRQRFSVLGALNAVNHELILYTAII